LHWAQPMRAVAAIAVVGAVMIFPSSASAQDKVGIRAPQVVRAQTPVVSVVPVMTAEDTSDDLTVAARRFVDEWSARLRPLEQRLRQDARLRRAGAVVGLSAAAIGAIRGEQTLTFVGTQAVRLGLDRQLTAIRAHSGFTVAPTIGHRRFEITVSKTY
jgi:hypothetical protein